MTALAMRSLCDHGNDAVPVKVINELATSTQRPIGGSRESVSVSPLSPLLTAPPYAGM